MSNNYWKQGNREEAEQIEAAFHQLMQKDMPDVAPHLILNIDDSDTLIVYDGVRKTICYLAFDSPIAQSIMESSRFKELPVPFTNKPRFSVGDIIFSKENPDIEYKILETGIKSSFSSKEAYKIELLSTEFKGAKRFIDTEKVDSWGELATIQNEAQMKCQPKYKVGQTVLFDGSVLTIHRIIEGYYLFNKEGSRGCRIDQQDKFVELKFKVGDYLKNKACDVTATVASIDVKGMCYRVHGYYPIPIMEQDEWENLDNPKFKVGDLVVFQDLIGRIREVTWQDHFGWAYKVGNIIDIHECALRAADHRDETRILKA